MICVDASVAIKWIVDEPFADRAVELLRYAAYTSSPFVAPSLLPFEITNILRRRVVRFGMPDETAEQLLTAFHKIPIVLRQSPALHVRALQLSQTWNLPAAYDAHYLALAEELTCDFWTDDQVLLRTLNGRLPFVRWIGEFEMQKQGSE